MKVPHLCFAGVLALGFGLFAPSASAQLHSQNFESTTIGNLPTGWVIASAGGNWSVQQQSPGSTSHSLDSIDTGAGPEIAYYDNLTLDTGYTYTVNLRTWGSGSGNDVGVVYNFQDTTHYYELSIAGQRVNSNTQRTWKIFERNGSISPTPVVTGLFNSSESADWITVSIVRSGTTTQFFLDGVQVHSRTQSLLTGGGKIGLVDRYAGLRADDLSVSDTADPTVTITQPSDNDTVSGNVIINATAADTGGSGLRGVQFKIDDTNLGPEDTSPPYSATWNSLSASNAQHVITAVATDNALRSASDGVFVDVINLPSGWAAADIGSPTTPGSTSYNSGTGTYTLTGTGTNIYFTSDQFHYTSTTVGGDFTVSARIADVQSTAPWAKAGIMVRENSTPTSRYVYLAMTPTNGLLFEGRTTTSGGAAQWGTVGSIDPAQWVKLVRSNDSFTAYYSNNGTSWTQVGSAQTVSMGSTPMVGLAACTQSGGSPAYTACEATIDSVSITASSTAAFIPGITEDAGPSYTPTHYVDFEHGLEGYPGTENQPWKYAPGMPGSMHTASAGDVIALKRGERWPLTSPWVIGQSGTSTDPIVFTAYGSELDPLPYVTVLEDISGSGWTPDGGDIYHRTVSGSVMRVYVDDAEAGEAAATSSTASEGWVGEPHVVYTKEDPDGSGTLYPPVNTRTETTIIKGWKQVAGGAVYLYSPSGDPNTNGATIEALKSTIPYVVTIGNQSHVRLDRLMLSGGETAAINISPTNSYAGTGLQITNCIIKSTAHGGIRVWVESTAAQTDGVIKWNKISSGQGQANKVSADDALYAYGNEPYSQSGLDNGITLYNGCHDWVVAQNEVSNFWHTQISILLKLTGKAGCKNNYVEHNEIHAGDINYAHGMEVVCDTAVSAMADLDGNVLRYNKVHHTWTNSKHEGKNTMIYGNLIYKVFGSPRRWGSASGWTGQAIVMRGNGTTTTGGVFAYNTIVDAAGAGLEMLGTSDGVPDGVVVANNIIAYCGYRRVSGVTAKGDAIQDRYSTEPHRPAEVDNNVLYYPTQTTIYERGTNGGSVVYHTVAQMEIDEPDWDNNVQADPLFTDYAAGDLTLAPSSPALGARKDISSILPESATWLDVGCWQIP